ncbi:MAG: ChrR family anti-sigma-E factor [Pseudomonadota bacterium]
MTTDVQHHISDDVLMGYAAGVLPQAFDLVVATHVSLSDEARARLETFEAVGGAVIDHIEEAEIEEDSLAQTLAKINDMSPVTPKTPAEGVFPAPLREVVGGDEDVVKWRSIGMGAKQCVLQSDKDATVRLLFIPAGQAMPKHSHRGTEMTLVLKGAFADEDGRYGRGDIEIADQDVDHSPVAEEGEDCICLVATDARLKFNGILPRIAQPFLGI